MNRTIPMNRILRMTPMTPTTPAIRTILVKAGMGVSLHGREFAASFRQDPAIVCAEIEPTLGFTYGLGYRDPEKLSRAERLYLAHMKNYELR